MFQLGAGHAGQPQVGQPAEHGPPATGRAALLTGGHRLGGTRDGLRAQGVVPGAVCGVPLQRQGLEAFLADRDAGGIVAGVQGRLDPQPGAGAGRLDGLDDHLVAGQGPAPPVKVMWENSRCSILFHLEVPGGKWQTVTCSPVSAASAASSLFQTR